jgi:hypothetical protein
MLAGIAAMWVWSTVASAAPGASWSPPRPYVLPIVNFSLVSVNGETSAQASGGLVGGMRMRYGMPPHWLSHTRAQAVGTYGVNTGSLGADARVGSFLGPDGKVFLYQLGPDIWYNGYGTEDSLDYHLPWSPGVDLRNVLTLKIVREVRLVGEATPGWAFVESRRQGGVGPFDELTLTGMAVIDAEVVRLTVGYTRQYRTFGVYQGLILSGAL